MHPILLLPAALALGWCHPKGDQMDLVTKSTSKMGEGETVPSFDALRNEMGLGPFPVGRLSLTLLLWWKRELKASERIFIIKKNLSKEDFFTHPGLKIGQKGFLRAWAVVRDESLGSGSWGSGAPPLFTCTRTRVHTGAPKSLHDSRDSALSGLQAIPSVT